jgi:CRP-like cAMP-binding protein/membrane protease YdiL (CAAX protease family)
MVSQHHIEKEPLSRDLENEIAGHFIFRGLLLAEVEKIIQVSRLLVLKNDEYLLQEGMDSSTTLYLLLTGNLDVIKEVSNVGGGLQAGNGQLKFKIATLVAGDVIGELSFIEKGPRSASIRSVGKSCLLCLDRDPLTQIETENPRVSSLIMRNLLAYVADRVKLTSANEVNALRSELENSVLTSKANLFFSYIIGILCVYNLAIHTITNLSLDAERASLISAVIIVLFSLALTIMIRHSQLPKRIFGLTMRNWRKATRESLFWTVIIVVVMITAKWTVINSVPRYHALPLFDFDFAQQKYLGLNFILYGLHSPIQEFIARGVLQGSLSHFFKGRNVTVRAVLISNALFSATHVHLLGGLLGVIVFVPGLFWGWMYSRHETLLGVSISHIIIGWMGLFVLNLESLF